MLIHFENFMVLFVLVESHVTYRLICNMLQIFLVCEDFRIPIHYYDMPKPCSWHWDHFHKRGKKNQAFNNAYCKYCVKIQVKEIIAKDERDVLDGKLPALRHSEMHHNDGKWRINAKHICINSY